MAMSSGNCYAGWRASVNRGNSAFREGCDIPPPERLLQAVWQHQRLHRDRLTTLDGQTVRVLHPGFKNRAAGPDFHNAVLQIGDEPPRSGDVEIDLNAAAWRSHGHDRNPNFEGVILHVIWEGERPAAVNPPATLALRGFLDAPLSELDLWLSGEAGETLPENLRGRCGPLLRDLPAEQLDDLLRQAAHVRLQSKAAWFQARARQTGWEQALWEGLFRALGYKQNVWPMQRLAELRPRWLPDGERFEPVALQARLLGLSGLLPTDLTRAQTGTTSYLRRIWDLWWREQDEFGDCLLPRAVWRFHGLRPANHPQRRLALAAHWLAAGDLVARLERWCASEISAGAAVLHPDIHQGRPPPGGVHPAVAGRPAGDAGLVESLLEQLQVERDVFWSWHWTLRSARLARPQPLLGATRVTDLAINVVVPWLWARATEGGNVTLVREIERCFFTWPAAGDNSRLRLARLRMLGGAPRRLFNHAAAQQGLLQVGRDFCEHSNALCDDCRFPELVRTWKT
jgi:hypothetical protein